MSGGAPIDLLFIWHHHQPDYRSPRDGRCWLPWVRLHATKDYLDMALRLRRFPGVRATFNFVPSLLDQIEASSGGSGEALFDLLRRPVGSLGPNEREEVVRRCTVVPRHALEKWPVIRRLHDRIHRRRPSNAAPAPQSDGDVLALEVWFLLAWLDPMFHGEPEAGDALAASENLEERHRDALLGLHDRLLGDVIPAYRSLADAGQVELCPSPYHHPILPLLVDVRAARRARPDLSLPDEPFSAPEDARSQIERALERHARTFGTAPRGMWPPEGSVSPEVVELAARAGVEWLATDEGILWQSLPVEARKREAIYRPWRFETPAGDVVLFFRDRELSDRIGFVYHHWSPDDAVADFLGRLRRIGADHGDSGKPVVPVILDGENCWEHYAEDGGPFLDGLYAALEKAPDIRTVTPSEVIREASAIPPLHHLHSGSWINSDFHIWVGHPEKNRAWDLLARARRALVERRASGEAGREAWEALSAAEGSDWFWWFGEDHYTPDKTVFDRLFREHLQAVYTRAGMEVPGWLEVPIASQRPAGDLERRPIGFVDPKVDGQQTGYYEWRAAGRYRLGGGGSSMHRDGTVASELYFGFDLKTLYVRVDFVDRTPPGPDTDLVVDILVPRQTRFWVRGLEAGERSVHQGGPEETSQVQGARCAIGTILELALPFETLGLEPADRVEFLGHLLRNGQVIETFPADELIRFSVPDASFAAAMWVV